MEAHFGVCAKRIRQQKELENVYVEIYGSLSSPYLPYFNYVIFSIKYENLFYSVIVDRIQKPY